MCPSYRVTRDEMHLTRGRANTLRLALSGQLGDDFANEAVREALDLCVSCKGCRRDCPTGVDMARMKIEFLHHYANRRGRSLRDRVVASLPRWAPWAARLPWLANARDRVPGAARLVERIAGIAAQRTLPRWRRDTFLSRAPADDASADVVLLVDTFTNYFEPENAHAAVDVLRAAGYRVAIARARDARPLCCGRTRLASGQVAEARREAQRTLDALAPHVQAGATVVGLEPSCLLSLRDEFLAMRLGEAATRLAPRAMLIEEFLASEQRAGRLELALGPLPQKRALVHGHCHQKAFDAFDAAIAVLKLVPGLDVEVVESSCCGMAGSFGYEAGHFDVSMRMAELALLPAVRRAAADTLIVANGTSCRHQVRDGTRGGEAREPVHVVRVLAAALGGGSAGPPQ
jgi:Fe-S oxidoreductase